MENNLKKGHAILDEWADVIRDPNLSIQEKNQKIYDLEQQSVGIFGLRKHLEELYKRHPDVKDWRNK
ncbi:MAG: hypothetical protein COA81_07425 [Alphaproteobacteria bacterium]|nr:MAG: hypothetical protein COA81_07425 [Alphaproteobacteria bacterium]